MVKINRFIKKNWRSIILPILGTLLLRIIDWIFNLSIFSTFLLFLKRIIILTIKLFLYKLSIPFWIILLICIFFIILLIKLKSKKKYQNKQNLPFLSFKEDNFGNVNFRWNYYFNSVNYEIVDITTHCTNCNCQLISDKCPNCGKDYYIYKKTNEEKYALIQHRIENKFKK